MSQFKKPANQHFSTSIYRHIRTSAHLHICVLLFLILISFRLSGQSPIPFDHTPLTGTEDLSFKMADGIGRFLDRELEASKRKRLESWHPDFSSREAYDRSMNAKRENFARIIGATDRRLSNIEMEVIANTTSSRVAGNKRFDVFAVKWNVFDDIHGEGLFLQPKGQINSRIIVVPDADQNPEMLAGITPGLSPELQYARRLVENNCQVIIPVLINRECTWSGSARLNSHTNQTHREWIYRQAYTFGHHIIGFEVQKILAVVDWFKKQNDRGDPLWSPKHCPIGIAGWGEGGLLGLYSAALDTRIDAALVSGYFSKRDSLWKEPLYRNLFGLLNEFGDAEIAGMILPRPLVIEYSNQPEIAGPPKLTNSKPHQATSAATGRITTPTFSEVKSEIDKIINLAPSYKNSILFIHENGKPSKPICETSLLNFMQHLHPGLKKISTEKEPVKLYRKVKPEERQERQIMELEQYIQPLIDKSRDIRDEFFWKRMKASTTYNWEKDASYYQDYLWSKVAGRIEEKPLDPNPKARHIFDKPLWTGYEVTLDVVPDIFAWGYLLIPKGLKPGEKRPVMVVQHGSGGLPSSVMNEKSVYNGIAVKLVELGYVVFAPHFPFKQGNFYRDLQRKANPLGLSMFSVILSQHEQILNWISSQDWVDTTKIGLYGLSWGGKIAVRVPALLKRYSLSICSGDFNEWIFKNATTDWDGSYMFYADHDIFDFNLGMTFNYGEMAALIAPRAFMVERGHNDGVGLDEWVAFEYAKIRRLYAKLNIPDKTEIEFFSGVHEIHAVKTLEFVKRHFGFPNEKDSDMKQ